MTYFYLQVTPDYFIGTKIWRKREKTLNKKFGDCFEDNELGIHFREDKVKCIVFDTKHRPNNAQNVKQSHILVAHWMKPFPEIQWLRKLQTRSIVNSDFYIEKTDSCQRLLCSSLKQPHFDYACSAWHPNLTKRLK